MSQKVDSLTTETSRLREILARIETKVVEDDRLQELQFSQINSRLKAHQRKLESVNKVAGGITALASGLGGLLAYLLG